MIVAKPVVTDQFWILRENNQKIGNVEAVADGYQVRINNTVTQFKTIKLLKQQVNITFDSPTPVTPVKKTQLVHGYPTQNSVYNDIWNLKYRLPLYTKTSKSKSWWAAGWYRIKRGNKWQVVQDPKLIALQRYAYKGPFTSKEQAI